MKFSLLLLISAVFIQKGDSYAYQKLQSLSETDNIRGCKDHGKLIPYGDWYNRLDCERISCQRYSETQSMISVYGCGIVDVSAFKPECISYPRHLNYPKCCFPVIKCKN